MEFPYSFDQLKKEFKKTIGIPFPRVFYPDHSTEPLAPLTRELLCFSQAVANDMPLPIFSDNLEEAPSGAWLAGFWGYGANSYAWYFVRKSHRCHVFLRLFYGGVYGEPAQDGKDVRRWVQRYAAFERWARKNGIQRWRIEIDMGSCRGWIEREPSIREEFSHENQRSFRFPNESGYAPGQGELHGA
jgi:hypothetical protein